MNDDILSDRSQAFYEPGGTTTGPSRGFGRTDAELTEKWPGLLFDNTSDYFMWGFSGSRRRLPGDPVQLEGADLIQYVLDRTPGWHSNLRRILELSDPKSTFPISIRTSVPVEPWRTTTRR